MIHSTKDMTERQKRIFNFIDANRVGVLASVDRNGEPHAAVIYYDISNKDFSISFITKTGTKKYDNLTRKNHVVLVIFEVQSQTVVQIFGKAHEVTDPYKVNEIANNTNQTRIKMSKGGILPIAKLEAGELTAFRIEPVQIRTACYLGSDLGDCNNMFESIESFELKP